ncbi:hypothetical protein, partial [Cobetia crustatorum]
MNTFQKPGNDPYSNTYNPGWARHPNFSWAKGPQQGGPSGNPPLQPYHQAGNQQPQQFPQYQQVPSQSRKPSLEDTLSLFMQSSLQFQKDTQQTLLANQQSLHANAQSIAKLEVQLGQLATALNEREKGKFPGQPVANPKGQYEIGSNSNQEQYHEQAKSIITLRSGKQIENNVEMPKEESNFR